MTDAGCPKCGRGHAADAVACARCGLVFAKWSPDVQAQAAVAELDAGAEALWTAALAHWTDEARHDAFAKYCSVAGLLAPAGRRYRMRLDEFPDDALATQMQKRIVTMATAAMQPLGRPPKQPFTRSRWFWIAVGSCVLLGAAAGFGASKMLGKR